MFVFRTKLKEENAKNKTLECPAVLFRKLLTFCLGSFFGLIAIFPRLSMELTGSVNMCHKTLICAS